MSGAIGVMRTSPGRAFRPQPRCYSATIWMQLSGDQDKNRLSRCVLAAIDAVDAAGVDPCDAAPDHWRHVHNRLSAGQPPRPYTAERHAAWLKRKAIGQ